jgi:hypothetical protein
MKLVNYFKHFLGDQVNLNPSRIDTLDSRVETITGFLKGHAELGPLVQDVIPQGSYAQKTIIRPRPERDFDADVLLHLDEQTDWEPCEYIANLYSAFRSSATYSPMVDRKTRCLTVQYANDFHVDVVPYLERVGGHYIANRHENRFEVTNPEGFNEWLDDQNRTASGHLVEVIRLLKYIRDFKGTFSVKSVILTTLLGGRVNAMQLRNDEKYYGDLPTAFFHIVRDLDAYLQQTATMPMLTDPSCASESFNHRWDQDAYANFRNKINGYARKISDAYHEEDKDASVALWQEVLGSGFKQPPATALQLSKSSTTARDTEEFLERDHGIPFAHTTYRLRIKGRLVKKHGFRDYQLSKRGNRVKKGRTIVFTVATCDVPKPFDIYWKVKNRGEEAERRDQLRGQIVRDQGGQEKREPTAFRGSHYVECYIVKNGACVAYDRQQVFVE